MKKKILIISSTILSILILVTVFLFINTKPVTSKEKAYTQRIEVPSGTTIKGISKKLKAEKLIKNKTVFYLFARYPLLKNIFTGNSETFSLKSGVYNISSDMSLDDIYKVLSSGKQEYIIVSIPEGLTISKIAARLEKFGVCDIQDFITATKNPELLKSFNINADSFEGFLFPDTYYFNPDMKGSEVIKVMVKNFFKQIENIPNIDKENFENLNKIVTLASIVEREYRIASEAKLIASVFSNRLRHNIGLYSCATIEYIITEIEGRPHPDVITYKDLSIDSPYNTYKWAGLPPGPISNPGKTALDAAANPAKIKYYFFRLVDNATGKHVFTENFSTHVNEGYIYNTKKTK